MALRKLGAAAVIINDSDEVLLVKHNYGHFNWEIPGGHAEANEFIVATAVREVLEETGLDVRVLALT
jgi:8-oxo-dGTP diphosphatase